ncbi:hypothetical protein HNR22_002307 [Micromonospora jinlongensis]|uniref:Uncharacterized protein n=1 Tax=Micromonospora jinlongensis TaxID=1287877 RepID=A0A7Z0BE73_9ACTN|nr:hypothetical protein [Micromonospora jinlongensis]NYH42580.1 hypothetical protein [Micromonospora jinlongensis]
MTERLAPVLRTTDANAAVTWYSRLGFVKQWEHQFASDLPRRAGRRPALPAGRVDGRRDGSDVNAIVRRNGCGTEVAFFMAKKQTKRRWLKDAPEWVKNLYKLRLELEYQRSSGEAFQELFDRIMRSIHSQDYVSTAAIGNEGDLGCDGYLSSKRMSFAVYGPKTPVSITAARSKMKKDFNRFIECWNESRGVTQWTFVVNHPGTHPSLVQIADELSSERLRVTIWSRYDLTQQFLLFGQRDLVQVEFGPADPQAKNAPPVAVVPEDNFVPSREITILHRMLWARITCNSDEYFKLTEVHCSLVEANPVRSFFASYHLLASAFMYASLEYIVDPDTIRVETVMQAAGIRDRVARKTARLAWNLVMKGVLDEYYRGPDVGLNGDIALMAVTSIAHWPLTLGVIRICSQKTGQFETAILDEVWSFAMDFKFHKE